MQAVAILLLVLVGTIPLAGINQSFAEKIEIPDWVKSTLVLWSDGEITNEEFVRAIEYLSEKGIVKLSSTNDKELQRQIKHLKAKSEVFKEETKQLREENEEYRILLKSQEINRSSKIPTSTSKIFDEYQALQIELKSLRETNKHLSKQIDSWISNGIPEQPIFSNNNEKTDINSDNIKQLNNLKMENKENLEKIKQLEEQTKAYQNNIKVLKLENQNKMQLISALKNRDSVNGLIQNEEKYESMITQLRNENFIQKQKMTEYENKIKSLNIITKENSDNLILVAEVESENKEMKKKIELLKAELDQKHEQIASLESIQMQKDEQLLQIQSQKPSTTNDHKLASIQEENESLLGELNYLKTKSIVNDEEIEVLRAENEEYRVLLNLLKKGQNSEVGFENMNHGSIDGVEGQGVVVYKTTPSEKNLPDDWIAKVKNSNVYQVYIEPSPRWSKDVSNEVIQALDFWKETANVHFEVVKSPSFGIITIDWKKELRNGYDGYVVDNTNISIGLGSSKCDGTWKPYSSESIKEVLIHELGHTVGLEHAVSKSNIMYPMIHNAKFAPIDKKFTMPHGDSMFIKGCSFSADPSYKYNVEVDDSKKVNIFFVPSIQEKYKVDSGEEFNYYSDMNCLGLSKSSKIGLCKEITDSGGMLIINSDNEDSVSVTVHLEEQ